MNDTADDSWIHEQMQLPSSELSTSAWYSDPTSSTSSPTGPGLATNGFGHHTTVHSPFVVDNGYQQTQSSYMPQFHQSPPVPQHTMQSHGHQADRPAITNPSSYDSHPENPIPNVTVHNPTNYAATTIDPTTYYAGFTTTTYPYAATYSSTPPADESHNSYPSQSPYPYGSLNGTPSSGAISPSSAEPPQQITIDPALVSISPSLAKQFPSTTTAAHPTYPTISPASLHNAVPADPSAFYGQHSRPQSLTHSTASTTASKTTKASTTPSSASPIVLPSRPSATSLIRKAQPTALKELLSPASLERSPVVAANNLIKALAQMGFSETSPALRKDILNTMRDNAGKDFYEAWAKNPDGMEMFRVWLKSASAKKDASGKKEVEETLMPLLNVIDRLPLGFEELRTSRIGKFIKSIVVEPPSKAAKDLASILTQKWTNLIAQQQKKAIAEDESKPLSTSNPGDIASKKRKAADAPTTKAPPAKKPPSQSTAMTSTASTTMMTVVKKEPGIKTEPGTATSSATMTTTKAAKTDSSFFSAPKKKALPTFKKVPKREDSTTVAQPSNFDPFQEALKALTAKGAPVIKAEPTLLASGTSGTDTETVDSPMNVDTSTSVNLNNMAGGISLLGKRKKSVTFATDDKLESIRWITRAEYGNDASEPTHSLNDIRALDRDEGRALHGHLFQEAVDWYEPTLIEIPQIEGAPLEERGIESVEKKIQEEREKNALVASYMSDSLIPDSASELHPGIGTADADTAPPVAMLPGPEITEIISGQNSTSPSSLGELLAQITPSAAITGAAPPAWTQPTQVQIVGASTVLSRMTPEMLQALQQQLAQATGILGSGGASLGASTGASVYGTGHNDQSGFAGPAGYGNEGQFQWGTDGRESGRSGWGSEGGDEGWVADSGYKGRGRGKGKGRGRGGGPRGDRPRPLCNFFAKGYCRFGETCDFWHDPALAHIQRKS